MTEGRDREYRRENVGDQHPLSTHGGVIGHGGVISHAAQLNHQVPRVVAADEVNVRSGSFAQRTEHGMKRTLAG